MSWVSYRRAGTRASCSVAACAILLAAFAGCGGGRGSPASTAAATTKAQPAKSGFSGKSAKVVINPVGNSKASGSGVYFVRDSRYVLKLDVEGLAPTHGEQQYALWQMDSRKDLTTLSEAREMVSLATYRVGTDRRLVAELEPTRRAFPALAEGNLTYFLITKVSSPTRLTESIVEYDETHKTPEYGTQVADGTFTGSMVGSAEGSE